MLGKAQRPQGAKLPLRQAASDGAEATDQEIDKLVKETHPCGTHHL